MAQECFIELMRSRARIRASLGAWLHTVAIRRCIDRIKGDARRRRREQRFAETRPAALDADDAATSEILACVDEAIEELPDKYRAVCVDGQNLQAGGVRSNASHRRRYALHWVDGETRGGSGSHDRDRCGCVDVQLQG
ncbi:MAG: hypothetical protein GWP08_09980 [Nitrospiraceae bacterium]|nr:hypothetical protein [Nitrospiraceae bacterium]